VTTTVARPRSPQELAELLRQGGRVRLLGTGSRQHRLPPAGDARLVRLDGLDRIRALDAADQTCSVEPGVARDALDHELRRCRLALPCLGDGTIGGMFASDEVGAAAVRAPAPRTLLLGAEAVLACGTAFKSGARVVKSVAGFDVHKLLVGSRGLLFAATLLHLKLAPRPRAEAGFVTASADFAAAFATFVALHTLAVPPAALVLRGSASGFTVAGRIAGRATFVAATLRAHGLREAPPPTAADLGLAARGSREVVAGGIAPSRFGRVLAAAAGWQECVLWGGGRFEVLLPDAAATDTLLTALPGLEAHGAVVGGPPARRGTGTPFDAGQRRLADGLKHALDPHGVLV
jgi:FAD/FMN-containing dehydrogenase